MEYGFIYMITNNINKKQYIGQTKDTIEMRWRKHIDNAKNNSHKQVITQAISKYGIENFKIEEIARCPIEDLNQWEIYYIKKYDTFQNGYNMTPGGNNIYNETKPEIVAQILYEANNSITNMSIIAKKVGVSDKTVAKILKLNHTTIKNRIKYNNVNIDNIKPHMGKHTDNLTQPCPIRVVELNRTFDSMLECAKFFIDNGYSKTDNEFNVMKSISRATANKDYGRNTYLGFHIEKIIPDDK